MEIIGRQQARERGLKRYFTGKPCKHGHIKERIVSSNACLTCAGANAKKSNGKKPDRAKLWAKNNPEKVAARMKRWRKKNNERVKQDKRLYRQRHPERAYSSVRKWCEKNPSKVRAIQMLRKHRVRKADGRFTAQDIEKMFSEQRGMCRYCEASLENRYHIDHRVPLARGGTNWPSNLQLLCQPCNNKKFTRDPDEYERSIGI